MHCFFQSRVLSASRGLMGVMVATDVGRYIMVITVHCAAACNDDCLPDGLILRHSDFTKFSFSRGFALDPGQRANDAPQAPIRLGRGRGGVGDTPPHSTSLDAFSL